MIQLKTYSEVQSNGHHEQARIELKHQGPNQIERKQRLHGIGRGKA